MKVALCISGQPRSVEAAFPYIEENIIKVNNPDIFIHSWIDDNIKGKRPVAAGGEVASDMVPNNIDEIILDLYRPKRHIFEPQKEFDEKNYNDRKLQFIRPKNSLSQKYSVLKAFSLCASNEKEYSAVIRMRFDWAIKVPMKVWDYPLENVIVPNDCPHRGGYNDQFAFSTFSNMATYSALYGSIDELYNKYNLPFCDEILLGQFLLINKIPVLPVHVPYKITRYTGDPNIKYTEDYIP
jgi:hypothetical protein